MRTLLAVLAALAATTSVARANYGYCFTHGLLGGTKVVVHDQVREADFWDGATVNAYRARLESAHRFHFGALTCPGFETEKEAQESLALLRRVSVEQGFADFPYPPQPAVD
ncbi:hypothetical protein IY145_17395 [Methylosinus sp. H3A]|uniref:hypothetical protein n=1 Tax=Methylosinus sp. H3A TaxID=2785786 RepID=UPI0018C2E91F|nr:hypothetical protein [Methylosinus sp. H3A]MBG0811148.1 hypothetical protein [Methylosinus sp. H3A]